MTRAFVLLSIIALTACSKTHDPVIGTASAFITVTPPDAGCQVADDVSFISLLCEANESGIRVFVLPHETDARKVAADEAARDAKQGGGPGPVGTDARRRAYGFLSTLSIPGRSGRYMQLLVAPLPGAPKGLVAIQAAAPSAEAARFIAQVTLDGIRPKR